MDKVKVTLIPGDGIGPEVVNATKKIIEAATKRIEWEECEAGASVFKKGLSTGVPTETIDSLIKTRLALKGPLETPVGFGEKSANVTLRKLFETYANIRPVRELPGVQTPYSGRGIDLVVVRENVEDLYAGIEHMQTPGVAQCLKVISRRGCEKIVRMAFEVARAEGRNIVHCATKSNIMKQTEGTLKRTFEELAKDYPEIQAEHIIIDNCAHQLVKKPEQFQVIVTTNMNGDIISDLSSGLIGGLGFAPSANLGENIAIFEAVHGSAPKYAGKNTINPTALLFSGLMLLRHIGEFEAASKIENAVIATLEEGKVMTRDVVGDKNAATTTAFTDEVIKNFGKVSSTFKIRDYKPIKIHSFANKPVAVPTKTRRVVGVDIFVETTVKPKELGDTLKTITSNSGLNLKIISNRGTKVYPDMGLETDCIDISRCRFMSSNPEGSLTDEQLTALLNLVSQKYSWMHVEKLQEFDGAAGYTKAQGED